MNQAEHAREADLRTLKRRLVIAGGFAAAATLVGFRVTSGFEDQTTTLRSNQSDRQPSPSPTPGSLRSADALIFSTLPPAENLSPYLQKNERYSVQLQGQDEKLVMQDNGDNRNAFAALSHNLAQRRILTENFPQQAFNDDRDRLINDNTKGYNGILSLASDILQRSQGVTFLYPKDRRFPKDRLARTIALATPNAEVVVVTGWITGGGKDSNGVPQDNRLLIGYTNPTDAVSMLYTDNLALPFRSVSASSRDINLTGWYDNGQAVHDIEFMQQKYMGVFTENNTLKELRDALQQVSLDPRLMKSTIGALQRSGGQMLVNK